MDSSSTSDTYVAYPMALRDLGRRLGAAAEELAAWVFYGPSDGGLAAYVNANEFDEPPRFGFVAFQRAEDSHDYRSAMMGTWFRRSDLDAFAPGNRFITGHALVKRWSGWPGLMPLAFIQAKIRESRLVDMHPILGATQGTVDDSAFPPLEDGIYARSEIEAIELQDFGEVLTETVAPRPDLALDAPLSGAAGADGADPVGRVARGAQPEDPFARAQRLLNRKLTLVAAGHKDFLLRIAAEEGGISTTRVKQLINRASKPDPFRGLGQEVPRSPTSRSKKSLR